MLNKMHLMVFVSLALTACFEPSNGKDQNPPSANTPTITVALQPLFPELQFDRPTGVYQAKNQDWYVTEQRGVIQRIKHGTQSKQEFLNLQSKVRSSGEMGLLGMALDNNFTKNGIFYVSYTDNENYSTVSRFYADAEQADKTSEEVILKQLQPYSNHNGGQITFGPDGFLYIALGDGGSAGDPEGNGQNLKTLLGSILRIDVSKGDPYAIPDTNPFINQDAKPEIYAYGLRNPWRFSFDKLTGDLWAADVGQNAWEEINIIRKGGNYGWNILEGTHCFTVGKCDNTAFDMPVYEYGRDEGRSVTGGYVYRGDKLPELQGHYVYGDFMSGKLWALKRDAEDKVTNTLLLDTGSNISSFGEDLSGELYVVAYGGKIYALAKN